MRLPVFAGKENLFSDLRGLGDCRRCLNMRENGEGGLSRVYRPASVCRLERTPVGADRRGGATCLLTQEDDGSLWFEGMVTADRGYESVGMKICEIRETLTGCAAAGDFVALLSDKGNLFYLLWEEAQTAYRYLGQLPALPDFVTVSGEAVEFGSRVDAVVFKTAQADLRQGVDSDNAARLGEAVKRAWLACREQAHGAGYWTGRVKVRLVLRLWDGSAARVSEPADVEIPLLAGSSDRVLLTLTQDPKKQLFTGTQAGELRVGGYRFGILGDGAVPAEWRSVVSAVEVWVTDDMEIMDMEADCRVSESHDQTGNYVSVILPRKDDARLERECGAAPYGLLASGSAGMDEEKMMYDGSVAYSAVLSAEAGLTVPASGAGCVAGHGGFLHIGTGSSLVTTRRGNPFVEAGRSDSVGGRIESITAQANGGGAYTRQYLYLGTDTGITALTCDAAGRHTNSRPVSAECPAAGVAPVATPEGVYCLSGIGNLLRLRDATATVCMRGLRGIRGLGWSHLHGELWLSGGPDHSLVLTDAGRRVGFLCSWGFLSGAGSAWPALVTEQDYNGLYDIADLDRDGDQPAGRLELTRRIDFRTDFLDELYYMVIEAAGSLSRLRIRGIGTLINEQAAPGRRGCRVDFEAMGMKGISAAIPLNDVKAPDSHCSGRRRWEIWMKGSVEELADIRVISRSQLDRERAAAEALAAEEEKQFYAEDDEHQ